MNDELICPMCDGVMNEFGDGFDSDLICEDCSYKLIMEYDTVDLYDGHWVNVYYVAGEANEFESSEYCIWNGEIQNVINVRLDLERE